MADANFEVEELARPRRSGDDAQVHPSRRCHGTVATASRSSWLGESLTLKRFIVRKPLCPHWIFAAAKPQIHVGLQRCLLCMVLHGDRAFEVALLPNANARLRYALVLVVHPHSEVPLNRLLEICRELAGFFHLVAGNAGMVPNVAEPSVGVFFGRYAGCARRGIIPRFAVEGKRGDGGTFQKCF